MHLQSGMPGTGVVLKAEVETGFGQDTCVWSGLNSQHGDWITRAHISTKCKAEMHGIFITYLQKSNNVTSPCILLIKAIIKTCQDWGGKDIDPTTQ